MITTRKAPGVPSIVGAVATLLLSLYWHVTSVVGGVEHSMVLFVLVFFLSLVDCTSSVTFLPFLAHYKPQYMTAFYVGEGMSGLLPTTFAFIQGSGEYTCTNKTVNGTSSIQPQYSSLLFSVQDFFLVLFSMLLLSVLAFALLRYTTYCNSERLDNEDTLSVEYHKVSAATTESCDSALSNDSNTPIVSQVSKDTPVSMVLSTNQYFFLLAIMAFVCALNNGALPSIQTYSLLPYGQLYYSWGVKLATLANPLACFLGFFLMPQSLKVIGVLTSISAAAALYIMVIAGFSPTPPIEGTPGAFLVVIIWVIFASVTPYLRLLISRLVMQRGHTGLFWLGVATQ